MLSASLPSSSSKGLFASRVGRLSVGSKTSTDTISRFTFRLGYSVLIRVAYGGEIAWMSFGGT